MDAAKEAADTVKAFVAAYLQENKESISINGPQLECFEPQREALLASLWKPQRENVPLRHSIGQQEGFITTALPDLLLNGLDEIQDTAQYSQPEGHEHICTAQQQGPTFLYGTSGAGKTRTIFEYLSFKKGFYFLADDFARIQVHWIS